MILFLRVRVKIILGNGLTHGIYGKYPQYFNHKTIFLIIGNLLSLSLLYVHSDTIFISLLIYRNSYGHTHRERIHVNTIIIYIVVIKVYKHILCPLEHFPKPMILMKEIRFSIEQKKCISFLFEYKNCSFIANKSLFFSLLLFKSIFTRCEQNESKMPNKIYIDIVY